MARETAGGDDPPPPGEQRVDRTCRLRRFRGQRATGCEGRSVRTSSEGALSGSALGEGRDQGRKAIPTSESVSELTLDTGLLGRPWRPSVARTARSLEWLIRIQGERFSTTICTNLPRPGRLRKCSTYQRVALSFSQPPEHQDLGTSHSPEPLTSGRSMEACTWFPSGHDSVSLAGRREGRWSGG